MNQRKSKFCITDYFRIFAVHYFLVIFRDVYNLKIIHNTKL